MASRRDCVIIPDMGAVLASWCSSRYDAENEMLLPPAREFSFNPELRSADGLLVDSVARAESISYEAARRIVRDDVATMWQQLRSYGDVPLGRLGVLHFHEEDSTLTFTPFASDCLSPATGWLRPIQVREAIVEARRTAETPRYMRISPVKRFIRVAASIAVLLGLGVVVSTPLSVPDDVTYASMAPKVETVNPASLMPTMTVPEPCPLIMEKSHDTDLWIEVAPKPILPKLDGRYCVIVSSHNSLPEAQRFIAKYKGIPMRVLEKDGRFRVYVATGQTMAEAERARASVSASFASAWVCKR